MFKHPVALLSVMAVALGVAACGGSGPSATQSATQSATHSASSSAAASNGGPAQVLTLAANPSGALKYDKRTLTAKAGKVTIQFTNMSPIQHDVTVQQGTSGPVLGATPTFSGGTKSVTLSLKPGKYTYYCSVPGHRAAGMLGTLTVK